ncbi:CHAT domain-containing protein [Amycolatopsis sp. CA-126428]|uniref:CHAT domain-containing protein n=1 Tax=Amycolatopsis sp. CA-126428 TaxID=2073158 RepID=UPI000CD05D97|nr:CHAT domain-containing protein [Amycolatopsis sp. CA-126428]
MTPVREFEELRLRVRQIGAQRYLVLANGATQGVRAARIGAEAAGLRAELNRLIDIETGNAPTGSANTTTGLRRLGQSVYDLLFDGALTDCVRRARAAADRRGLGLRLRFDLPAALQALPVETLCSPSEQPEQTFALDGNLSIARSLRGSPDNCRLPAGDDLPDVLHLLIAIAAPHDQDLPAIDAAAELAELADLPPFLVQTHVIRHTTRADIEKWLTDNAGLPTAVLLIAHGGYQEDSGEGVVILEARDGTADVVPGHVLSGILVRARKLRLIVLNLCFGARNSAREPFAGLAQAMVGRGIPAVVAMQGLVTDRAAGVFGPKLLTGICANNSVDEAMTSARHHIANLPGHTAIEWATPALFLHPACGLGWLFKVREVRDDDESTDPLRAGEEALGRLRAQGNIRPAIAVAAARFLRLRQDWQQVESIAKAAQGTPEQAQLVAEARLELAWPDVERVCDALAEADHDSAQRHLDQARNLVPDPVLRLLTGEIAAARKVGDQLDQARKAAADGDWKSAVDRYRRIEREQPAGARDVTTELGAAQQEIALAEHYAELLAQHEAEHWEAALAEASAILGIRESGYRDTEVRVGYLTARLAETQARWSDAVSGYAACQGFADAPGRSAHAHGHALIDLGDWPGAENHFRAAVALGVDDDHLAGYAAARVAEDAGRWAAARQTYAGLPDTMLDVGARRRYVDGMLADSRDDWPGVTDGFAELPDDFADGEVGRRRQFARAELAGEREDWRAVLTGLGATPDAYRGGSAGVLRWTARGRLAEDSDDWARAVECYATVPSTGELELARRYATGRRDEHDGDYAAALDTYGTLPRDHRDVRLRIGYVTARASELASDWAHAADLYSELPNDFLDVPTRRRYATLRAAIAAGRWTEVADAGDAYSDTLTLAAYARGRLAEERTDWGAAIVAYESCGDHADAAGRADYARGRRWDAAGQWSRAKAAYDRAAASGRDVRHRRERLDFLLAELPFAEGIAEATLVADPVMLREPTFPYLALDSAGVSPASPTEVVADATFILMERGVISWRERMAWDQLRTPAKRLLVDARMYRLREPEALRRALATMDSAERAPLSWLCARLPGDAPLLTLLAGDRPRATALWQTRLRARPDDQHDAHCLGLTSFWHAQDLEEAGAWELAAPVWRTALACLATVLTDDEFWTGWRQGRAACYGHAVTPADTALLRIELGRYLIGVLTGHADRHANAGQQAEADRYQELVFRFEAELDAAQCLKEAGGLPLRGGEGRLSCGPEYLRLVGLSRELGEFIAGEHQRESDADGRSGLRGRLRCAFSGLSAASSFLDHHRFERALRALPDYHRLRRRELPEDCAGPARHGGVGDCPHCREFVAHDPAYTYLPRRRSRMLVDAVGLAVRARLSIARDLLAGRQLDPAIAGLAGAIDIADNAQIGVRAREATSRMIIGRADVLAESTAGSCAGLDEAIELVERALPAFGDPIRTALTRKLAALLVDRGVWHGSACAEFGLPADLARAVGELRRALRLDPDSAWVRYNLVQGLLHYSGRLTAAADKLAPLFEALSGVHGVIDQAGPTGRLRWVLGQTVDAIGEAVLGRLPAAELHRLIQSFDGDPAADLTGPAQARALAGQADRRRAAGDLSLCVHYLVMAVRADPSDERYRVDLLAALEELLGEGGPADD